MVAAACASTACACAATKEPATSTAVVAPGAPTAGGPFACMAAMADLALMQ